MVRPDLGVEGDACGGRVKGGADGGLTSAKAEHEGGSAAGAGVEAEGSERPLGPEAGRRASEVWAEPRCVGEEGLEPEPARGRGSGVRMETGGRTFGALAGIPGWLCGAAGSQGGWTQEVAGFGSSPGFAPDCALGLTPEGGPARQAPVCHWWRRHGRRSLEL